MVRKVITYGTFDLFHIGHLRLLNRLRSMGNYLIVGISTDEFNASKGKESIIKYSDRMEIVKNLKCVDMVIPEETWDQKITDIKNYDISVFGMGHDWEGKFDFLQDHCEVVYLPRTESVSSTQIKKILSAVDRTHVSDLKKALDIISNIIERLD